MIPFPLLRRACGLTQAECARYLDVSKRSVEEYDGGRTNPPAAVVAKMRALHARILDIAAGYHGEIVRYATDEALEAAYPDIAMPCGAWDAVMWRVLDGMAQDRR